MSLPDPSLPDPSLADPSLADPSLADPSLPDPSLAVPSLAVPSLADPSLADPSLADPSLAVPSLPDPVVPRGTPTRDYASLLAQATRLYPGIRVGRPGHARSYWPTILAMRALRLRLAVHLQGADRVAPGPAILIGNHVHFLDPVCLVMTVWWRVSAFTKVEWFEHRSASFFRFMGQIPLRRGDAESTEWAMQMSRHALAGGGRLGLYPEGTRSPNPDHLHRLHKRVMVPLLQANPDVPVHVVTARYENHRFPKRIQVEMKVSDALPLDIRAMSPGRVTDIITEHLLELGGQTYVDRYAQEVKVGQRPVSAPEVDA